MKSTLLLAVLMVAFALGGPAVAEEESLPIYLTPDELLHLDRIGEGHRSTEPPPAVPRNVAEWEPLSGVLIRYPLGLPWDLIVDFSNRMKVYCLVSSGSQSAASAAFTGNGVNMANVQWCIMPTNSYWTRDYGPWFVFDGNGDQAISDHIYNRPRPDDDHVNWVLGPLLGIDVYGHDLLHTGGNYMTDGHGISFSTTLVWSENSGLTHAQIEDVMYDYLGVHTYHVIQDVATGGIHHIDCWAKLLDEETVLVKQVPVGHAEYTRCEQNAATIAALTNCYGRPYRVVRVYCPVISGGVASYTNSLILNDRVYVPIFNRPEDADALAVYEAAMPGYEIVGYDGSWLSDDAIHCRGMGMADKGMLYVDHSPIQDTEYGSGDYQVSVQIRAHSDTGILADSCLVHWRTEGEATWHEITLQPTPSLDVYDAFIPEQTPFTVVEYWVSAMDNSAPEPRHTMRPWVAPAGFYSFDVLPGAVDVALAPAFEPTWGVAPSPFRFSTTVRFSLREEGPVRLGVFSADGRLVDELATGAVLEPGTHVLTWEGTSGGGEPAAPGVYFFRLEAAGRTEMQRGVRLR